MRREFIYPHRSVRTFPISGKRVYVALAIAALVCAAVLFFSSAILDFHSRLVQSILSLCNLPVSGSRYIEIFSFLKPVTASIIAIPQYQGNFWRFIVPLSITVAMLILIYRMIPLGRSFIVFLMTLLCAASVVVIVNPAFQFGSAAYEQTWVRAEFLVWILLPWVSSLLFAFTIPSPYQAFAWGLLLQVYSVACSAVRLVFCLGVFHYTGIVFLPMLWFCLGVLFDLVYIMVFYSFALRFSMRHALGERKS